jgi:hypothetical protein
MNQLGGTLVASLAKAGGIADLAICVFFLTYREAIKQGLFPRLPQWQAFALLCLLLIIVTALALAAIKQRKFSTPACAVAERSELSWRKGKKGGR